MNKIGQKIHIFFCYPVSSKPPYSFQGYILLQLRIWDSSVLSDSVVTAESWFLKTTFYTIFIHLHPSDEAKNLNSNNQITTNRPLQTPKVFKMEAEMKADNLQNDFWTKVGIINLTFWTSKSLLLFITLQEKATRNIFCHSDILHLFRCTLMKKQIGTLKCL